MLLQQTHYPLPSKGGNWITYAIIGGVAVGLLYMAYSYKPLTVESILKNLDSKPDLNALGEKKESKKESDV